jgi:uncharacterized repeat protein (TIGR03803 family)
MLRHRRFHFAFLCVTMFSATAAIVSTAQTFTTLYNFCSQVNCADGSQPTSELVQGLDGSFYGTTYIGGANSFGTVFTITPSGTLTTLHSFGGDDGGLSTAGLVQGTDGNFYGTTQGGGTNGDGTAFKITPSGTLTTLHSFDGSDGSTPYAGLIQATDGNFYGTTYSGGTGGTAGTAFKITPSGTLTTLHSFGGSDGVLLTAGLVQGTDGNFYGTTFTAGPNGYGTVFRLNSLVSVSPTNLDFGPQGLNIPNTPQAFTLTNSGGAPLLITNIVITGADRGDFSQSNNCPLEPGTLTPGGFCSITVVFSPIGSGMRTADVAITDNAPDSPQMVPLTGVGVGGKVRPK